MNKVNKNNVFMLAIAIIALSFLGTGLLFVNTLRKQIDENANVVNDAILSTICDSLNSEIANNLKGADLDKTLSELGVELSDVSDFVKQYEEKYDIELSFVNEEEYKDLSQTESGYISAKYIDNFEMYIVLIDDGKKERSIINGVVLKEIIIYGIFFIIISCALYYLIMHERKEQQKEANLLVESTTDGLTGMLNRKAYEQELAMINADSQKRNNIFVIVMDVNGLKSVNDNIGHTAGDELIVGASICIESTFGKIGKCFRIGGDEFTAIVQAERDEIDNVRNTFVQKVNDWQGKTIKNLAVSVGVASCEEYPDLSIEEVIKVADKAMYEDKRLYYERTGIDRRKR